MSRVITFSRYFPSYHPRKGELTYFVEKLNRGLGMEYGIPFGDETEIHFRNLGIDYSFEIYKKSSPKYHTIRAGNRWKVGDKFSPRVWSGKPYNSKQIIIAPDITIVNVFDVEFLGFTKWVNGEVLNNYELAELAKNDGLNIYDFNNWFNKLPFVGQVICWSDKIKY